MVHAVALVTRMHSSRMLTAHLLPYWWGLCLGGLPNRDPPGQRPPRQRPPRWSPPGQRPLLPWQRPPTPLDRDPPTETPLDRDPPDIDPLDRDPPGQRPSQTETPLGRELSLDFIVNVICCMQIAFNCTEMALSATLMTKSHCWPFPLHKQILFKKSFAENWETTENTVR